MSYKNILSKIIIFSFAYFATIVFIIVSVGNVDRIQPSSVIVVLGNKINNDGTPSLRLKARLEKALELYKNGFGETILVSGGMGKEGYDEAKIMKQYLENKGVGADKIIVDSQGLDTISSARNVKNIFSKNQNASVILVSQYYHLLRSKSAFKTCGFKKIYTAHAPYYEWRDLYSVLREFAALHAYLFKNCE